MTLYTGGILRYQNLYLKLYGRSARISILGHYPHEKTKNDKKNFDESHNFLYPQITKKIQQKKYDNSRDFSDFCCDCLEKIKFQ